MTFKIKAGCSKPQYTADVFPEGIVLVHTRQTYSKAAGTKKPQLSGVESGTDKGVLKHLLITISYSDKMSTKFGKIEVVI